MLSSKMEYYLSLQDKKLLMFEFPVSSFPPIFLKAVSTRQWVSHLKHSQRKVRVYLCPCPAPEPDMDLLLMGLNLHPSQYIMCFKLLLFSPIYSFVGVLYSQII